MVRTYITRINNKKQCSFCKHAFQSVSDDYCSKKCMDADEIVDNVQKIIFCAKILKEKYNQTNDPNISKIINVLEISVSKTIANINSLEKEFSKYNG
jgi:hypothetical protein